MAKKATQTQKRVTEDGDGGPGFPPISFPDVIMCQMTYALGSGADMWICTDAIAWFRLMYYGDVQHVDPSTWQLEGAIVLDLCKKIGRRAAWIALSKAKTHIGLRSLDQAIGDVMASIPRRMTDKNQSQGSTRGAACANYDETREEYGIPRNATD